MKNKISQKLKNYRFFSVLTILSGVILIIYMINVEDEIGALPLVILLSGIGWFFRNQVQIKKQLREKC
jgi:hypothetical protein